jgi:lipopolysaccharide transport system ATP-binding protein
MVVECRNVQKRFYRYEHRTRTMREFFIRTVLRRPIHVRRAHFSLESFDLQVYRGDSIALIGGNGSGKSTALRLIAGIYAPTQGIVRTSGRLSAIIDLGVGFHPELTGIENVAQYGAMMGIPRRAMQARTNEIVEFSGIGEFAAEPIKYYSSGMHARLAFATAALCVKSDILLIDEVLAVGDRTFQQRCLDHLDKFRADGGTLIVVSHIDETVRALCERCIWLDRGRVRMSGPTADVMTAYSQSSQPAASSDL